MRTSPQAGPNARPRMAGPAPSPMDGCLPRCLCFSLFAFRFSGFTHQTLLRRAVSSAPGLRPGLRFARSTVAESLFFASPADAWEHVGTPKAARSAEGRMPTVEKSNQKQGDLGVALPIEPRVRVAREGISTERSEGTDAAPMARPVPSKTHAHPCALTVPGLISQPPPPQRGPLGKCGGKSRKGEPKPKATGSDIICDW